MSGCAARTQEAAHVAVDSKRSVVARNFSAGVGRLTGRDSSHFRRRAVTALATTIVVLCAVAWLFPLWLSLITSLKSDAAVAQAPLSLPTHPTLHAYATVWGLLDMGLLFRNSFIITVGGTLLSVALSLPAAFLLSRFRWPGREVVFFILLAGLTLPQQIIIIPLYDIMAHLQLLNSFVGLIIIHGAWGIPFCTLILRGFMLGLPQEIEDGARVDGCGDAKVFWHVILPMSGPAIATVCALQFLNIWNEFFFALIFLSSSNKYPVTIGLADLTASPYLSSWNLPAAAALLAQLPTLAVYLVAQRWIVRGVGAAAGAAGVTG
jgi:raffinose/stachyose/melibiose transport system permease protein